MSIFAMQLANAFSARELSGRQSLLKSSIHKISSGTRLVKAQDDSGMLSVKMKMDTAKYKNASSMNKLKSAVSYTDMQDGILNNAQSVLTRMSELKGLSINDPLKSEQDIDAYNNEFRDLQRQLFQLSKTTFNGTRLFATTTKKLSGEEVRFRGSDEHKNLTSIITESSTINLQKLPLLAALTVGAGNTPQPIDQTFYGTGFDSNGNVVPVGGIDGNYKDIGGGNLIRSQNPPYDWWDPREPVDSLSKWVHGDLALDFDLSDYHKDDVQISFDIASVEILDIKLNGQKIDELWAFGTSSSLSYSVGKVFEFDDIHQGWKTFKVDIGDYLQDGINQLSFSDTKANEYKIKNVQISAVRKDGGNTNIGYSDRLNSSGTIALAIENEISLSNLENVQMSYFNQAIENISYLRAQTSATKSRLKFTSDLEYENKSLTNKAYGRIADVDYALESLSLTKQKIMTSASAAMIAQANTMGDVVLAMLN